MWIDSYQITIFRFKLSNVKDSRWTLLLQMSIWQEHICYRCTLCIQVITSRIIMFEYLTSIETTLRLTRLLISILIYLYQNILYGRIIWRLRIIIDNKWINNIYIKITSSTSIHYWINNWKLLARNITLSFEKLLS